jgi:hypothetical protein
VSSVFSLHALAAKKMPQLQNHLCRHAAEKPAIHARRSKTNPSNSQSADKATFPSLCLDVRFGFITTQLGSFFRCNLNPLSDLIE